MDLLTNEMIFEIMKYLEDHTYMSSVSWLMHWHCERFVKQIKTEKEMLNAVEIGINAITMRRLIHNYLTGRVKILWRHNNNRRNLLHSVFT